MIIGATAAGYLRSALWLLVPLLAFDAVFAGRLPAIFQPERFWQDVPLLVAVPENVLRTAVVILPVFMRLGLRATAQKIGLALYIVGLIAYAAAWAAQIGAPASAWSTSATGFLAPAYTPALWLAGIGLMADGFLIPCLPYRPWVYLGLSAAFLAFHNAHAAIVFTRLP